MIHCFSFIVCKSMFSYIRSTAFSSCGCFVFDVKILFQWPGAPTAFIVLLFPLTEETDPQTCFHGWGSRMNCLCISSRPGWLQTWHCSSRFSVRCLLLLARERNPVWFLSMEWSSFPRSIHCTGDLVLIGVSHLLWAYKLGFLSGLSILLLPSIWMSCVTIPCCLHYGGFAV